MILSPDSSGSQCKAALAAACIKKAKVNAGWAICLLSFTKEHRKHSFHIVGTPFLAF